jgi:hypothetical protein
MKKSLRLALASAILMAAAPINMFAAVGGTNPHPQVASVSYYSVAASVILTALGF